MFLVSHDVKCHFVSGFLHGIKATMCHNMFEGWVSASDVAPAPTPKKSSVRSKEDPRAGVLHCNTGIFDLGGTLLRSILAMCNQ